MAARIEVELTSELLSALKQLSARISTQQYVSGGVMCPTSDCV